MSTTSQQAATIIESGACIALTRDCEAIQIPDGDRVTVPAGTDVRVTQALGGSFTVMTERGGMLSIAGQDADALGIERADPAGSEQSSAAEESLQERILEQLKTCYDPEIPVNIVDLGLIYGCAILDRPEGGKRVQIQMTLTAPGCGMGDVLIRDVERKLLRLPEVKQVDVEMVFSPPWDLSRMSEAARLELGPMW